MQRQDGARKSEKEEQEQQEKQEEEEEYSTIRGCDYWEIIGLYMGDFLYYIDLIIVLYQEDYYILFEGLLKISE